MQLSEIHVCPGTLMEGFQSYSPTCLRQVFNGKKVSHILPFNSPRQDEVVAEQFLENRRRVSISGVQEKLSMVLLRNKLQLTREHEQGTYILKPIPRDLKKVDQVPANEHLTMQIARQVYRIPTAENALVFFNDGVPAYITKRFDIRPDGNKLGKEDFATLAGRSVDNGGPNFKYGYSYEGIGRLIQQFVPSWRIAMERYLSLVVFNYLLSNGDAHLKNFSLLETINGDYTLSPAYDLINTRLHVDDTDFALDQGLFSDGFRSNAYKKNGHASIADFAELGMRLDIAPKRLEKILFPFVKKQEMVEVLVGNSFLSDSCKRGYLLLYQTKRNYFNAE